MHNNMMTRFLTSVILIQICHGQFLTPDQLREQHDLGFGARTHYEMSGSRRTDMFNRINPDYLLRGFFPFWSVLLIALSLIFLGIAIIAIIGYFLGCRRPTAEELYANEFGERTPDDEFLLGGGGTTVYVDDKASRNELFGYNDQRGQQFNSSPLGTRIGQSDEDMV